MPDKKDIHILQADIIYKALHYVCRNEGIQVNEELKEVFNVLAEINPNDTNASDCIDIMDSLKEFIKQGKEYKEYFNNELDQEEE